MREPLLILYEIPDTNLLHARVQKRGKTVCTTQMLKCSTAVLDDCTTIKKMDRTHHTTSTEIYHENTRLSNVRNAVRSDVRVKCMTTPSKAWNVKPQS